MTAIKSSCFSCLHFFISHHTRRPYGCRAMGFLSWTLPAEAVARHSGTSCLAFVPKKQKT